MDALSINQTVLKPDPGALIIESRGWFSRFNRHQTAFPIPVRERTTTALSSPVARAPLPIFCHDCGDYRNTIGRDVGRRFAVPNDQTAE